MRLHRVLATGVSLATLLGLSVVQGQKSDGEADRRALDARAFTVRLLLGVGDSQEQTWSGRVKLDKGDVVAVEGWRFRQGDRVTGADSWEAQSRLTGKAANKKAANKKAAAKKQAALAKAAGAGGANQSVAPNGVIVTLKAPEEANLTVETDRGKFTVALADLAGGAARTLLDGRVEVQRVPPHVTLFDGPDQEDFPSAAADRDGAVWVAFVAHEARGPAVLAPFRERPKSFEDSIPNGGGDQVRLVRFAGGRPGTPIDVTAGGLDVWRPALAIAGDGAVVVTWSEFKDGNWDLFRRRYNPAKKSWSEPKRLTTDPGADADAVLATAPDGNVWLAWQAWRNGQADILLARVEDSDTAIKVSDSPANEWSPALAIDKGGRIHVAFDTYQAGNYDVVLRTRGSDGTFAEPIAVADSPLFEARPSLALDPSGSVWVAYEERTKDWGKDAENLQDGQGSTLYRSSAVRVRRVDGNRRFEAPDPVAQAAGPLRLLNSFPRVATDRSGRVWLAYRHRQEPRNPPVGGVWIEQVTSLSGRAWDVPQVLPRSDAMLDNRPSLVVPGDGPPVVVYDGDNRLQRIGEGIDHGLHVAALVAPAGPKAEPVLAEVARPAETPSAPIHPTEAADVARIRAYRIQAGDKTYRPLRGEFHRHTEISGDGANDGALEEMWRYAIDVASLDWIGNGDHDNGGGKEYTWWLTQKTTDLYHSTGRFTPMFTYERSVVYPHGHRNVMWAKRGIRTLPRLQNEEGTVHDDDTKMLYEHLNALGGICASHTSATTQMGTDWRDNDPKAEPIVEIFQGHRNSYEHLGAPRVGRSSAEAIAGLQPYGLIWNALALQYRLGFQASSDHISTHISYAVALAEDQTRDAILDAFRRRHCYAATDNILLDVRSGDHLMGDEFDADGPVRLRIQAHGTRPIAKVDIIKDFVYVYSTEPKQAKVAFEWTDDEQRTPPLSWYYVRVIQDDGELAWGSPMWVHRRPARAGERIKGGGPG
ncbi:MAG: hypothetical protein P4L84_15845 [Isosphaeraceae bacterium]|nr:hypothetical protein [Isosphaeraceae bacterium]